MKNEPFLIIKFISAMKLLIIHNFYMMYLFFLKNPKVINELIKGRTYLHYACDYGQKVKLFRIHFSYKILIKYFTWLWTKGNFGIFNIKRSEYKREYFFILDRVYLIEKSTFLCSLICIVLSMITCDARKIVGCQYDISWLFALELSLALKSWNVIES
jgi:hypothetical protein